jgi:hypothetical protein
MGLGLGVAIAPKEALSSVAFASSELVAQGVLVASPDP